MKALMAFERTQAVCLEFRALGHEAYSCDVQPCGGDHPEWHLQSDVFPLMEDPTWDIMIAFPPCTHLAVSGAKHFAHKQDGTQAKAIEDFARVVASPIRKKAIENPVGIMSSIYRKPDQIIHPFYFGDTAQKRTCLWLFNLPRLIHSSTPTLFETATHVSKGEFVTTPSGKKLPKWYSDNTDPDNRAKTFPGIARAMAQQWGNQI